MASKKVFTRLMNPLELAIDFQRINASIDDYFAIRLGANKKSIYVDPMYGCPFVYEKGGKHTVFEFEPTDRDDKLRARELAMQHFGKVNASALGFRAAECDSPTP